MPSTLLPPSPQLRAAPPPQPCLLLHHKAHPPSPSSTRGSAIAPSLYITRRHTQTVCPGRKHSSTPTSLFTPPQPQTSQPTYSPHFAYEPPPIPHTEPFNTTASTHTCSQAGTPLPTRRWRPSVSGTASTPPPQRRTPKEKPRMPYTPSSSATSNNLVTSTSLQTASPPPPSHMNPTLPCRLTTDHGTRHPYYLPPSPEYTPHSSLWSTTTPPPQEPSMPSPPIKSQLFPHNTPPQATTSATQSSVASHFS